MKKIFYIVLAAIAALLVWEASEAYRSDSSEPVVVEEDIAVAGDSYGSVVVADEEDVVEEDPGQTADDLETVVSE